MVRQHAGRIEHIRALPRSLLCSGLAQDARTPPSPLGEMSPRPPEPLQRPAKAKASACFCLREAPLQTRPQVLVLLFETPQPLCLLRTSQFRVRLLRQRQVVVPMPYSYRLGPTTSGGGNRPGTRTTYIQSLISYACLLL